MVDGKKSKSFSMVGWDIRPYRVFSQSISIFKEGYGRFGKTS